jgi:hypothetical protein
MATSSTPASPSDDNAAPVSGQQVAVQLEAQGWALTRPGPAYPPDDPCNPSTRPPYQLIPPESPSPPAPAKERM